MKIYGDMDRFSCGYCGTEMLVQRRGGTVALKLVTDAIQKVQIGTDKVAAELAIVRLKEELLRLSDELQSFTAQSDKIKKQVDANVGNSAIGGVVVGVIGCLLLFAGMYVPGIVLLTVALLFLTYSWRSSTSAEMAETESNKTAWLRQIAIVNKAE